MRSRIGSGQSPESGAHRRARLFNRHLRPTVPHSGCNIFLAGPPEVKADRNDRSALAMPQNAEHFTINDNMNNGRGCVEEPCLRPEHQVFPLGKAEAWLRQGHLKHRDNIDHIRRPAGSCYRMRHPRRQRTIWIRRRAGRRRDTRQQPRSGRLVSSAVPLYSARGAVEQMPGRFHKFETTSSFADLADPQTRCNNLPDEILSANAGSTASSVTVACGGKTPRADCRSRAPASRTTGGTPLGAHVSRTKPVVWGAARFLTKSYFLFCCVTLV